MINVRGRIFGLLVLLVALVFLPVAATAQSNLEMKKIFAEAESCNLLREYESWPILFIFF